MRDHDYVTGGHPNRVNVPPFKHSTKGVVYRARGWRIVRKGGVKWFKYTGWM